MPCQQVLVRSIVYNIANKTLTVEHVCFFQGILHRIKTCFSRHELEHTHCIELSTWAKELHEEQIHDVKNNTRRSQSFARANTRQHYQTYDDPISYGQNENARSISEKFVDSQM